MVCSHPGKQHAYACEHLLPYLRPGSKVLDVGSGSGYLVAVLHNLVGPGGKVVGIDHIKELVDFSVENLKEDGKGEALQKGEIIMVTGDGRLGYPEEGKPLSTFSSTLPFFLTVVYRSL